MRRTTILNAAEVKRMPYMEATNAFYKHCRLKSLHILDCIICRISRFKIRDSIREHNSSPQVSIAKGIFQE